MPTMQEIAQDIYSRAQSKGINPNVALGLALREGLTKGTINSPTFGNRDAKGYSYGPWQLYSGSPVAGAVAPGGQAAQFMRQYGQRPHAGNWQLQNEFALNLYKSLTPQQRLTTWYAIRDNGGEQALARVGLKNAMALGLSTTPGSSATPTTPLAAAFTTPAGPAAPTTPPGPPAPPSDPTTAVGGDLPPIPQPPADEEVPYDLPETDVAAAPEMAMPGDIGDLALAGTMDFEPTDATLGLSDHIREKAALGKQRRAEMETPLGQLFDVAPVGRAGRRWG